MRWSEERIWEWYNSRPWMRGCNYISYDCANRIDQWQALGSEKRFEIVEEELKLMQKTGYNTVRLILEYVVWKEEHDSFMERFERYLALYAKYGISCMIVLANDCMPPKTEDWKLPYIGEQEFHWGYQFSRKRSQHGHHAEPAPHFYLDDPETRADYYRMVREIVTKYKDDERICIWDIYNEPGNSRRGEITLPVLKEMFALVREIDPIQPLTCAIWSFSSDENIPYSPMDRFILDNSDIISYHSYSTYTESVRQIRRLKMEGRPIMNSEWLARCIHNNVQEMFPLFYLENVACMNWGFVAGRSQTTEPWEMLIDDYDNGSTWIDMTKWFHDLYRGSHRPYDPQEIAIIKDFCALADRDFAEKNRNA